jgi:PAS domain S-box-containing protein
MLQFLGDRILPRQSLVRSMLVVGLSIGFMAAFRLVLDPILMDHHPFMPFLVPVMISTYLCGWRAGVAALGLGLATSDILFLQRGTVGLMDLPQLIGFAVFAVVGAATIALVEALDRARIRSDVQARFLQKEICSHRQTQKRLRQTKVELEQRVELRTTELAESHEFLREEALARLEAEAKLRRLASIVESSEDAIIGKDLEGIITDWNAGAEHLFGWKSEEIVGRHISVLAAGKEERKRVLVSLQRQEEVPPYETMRRARDGKEIPVSVRISPIREKGQIVGMASINRDLRQAKKLEEQVRQAQKMESIGQLAGGVAHDFNNILTIIFGCTDILLSMNSCPGSAREFLTQIQDAGERGAGLTRQLLAFSRRQVMQLQEVNLNEVVARAQQMLERLIGEDVQLTTVLATDLGAIQADPGQIEQVIMNLAVNARDAMPQGGQLTIETRQVDLSDKYGADQVGVAPGHYALLAVTDSGEGMDAATTERIFEPFFTTKEVGKGTGLGLAVVHGIVKQTGGKVSVYSELCHGTTFKIYLPLARLNPAPAGKDEPDLQCRGSETILLVEDEPAVRQLTRKILESAGYTVLEASDGDQAIRLAREHEGKIDLVATDVVMPKISGRALVERIRPYCADSKVLFLSGYTDDAVVRHGIIEATVPFLQKPFTLRTLTNKVRTVLDGGSSAKAPAAGGCARNDRDGVKV